MGWFPKLFQSNKKVVSHPTTYREQLKEIYKSKKYKTLPYLPSESESERIVKTYKSFPSSLVAAVNMRSMAKFKDTDIYKGEIIMLWWLNKNKINQNPPAYFLYKYGLNFKDSRKKMTSLGLIDETAQLTDMGKQFLASNLQAVREHQASSSYSPDGNVTFKFKDEYDLHSPLERLEYLWKNKQIAEAITHGEYMISNGDKNPAVFRRMAIIYRSQKDFQNEERVLLAGIKAQNDINNTGVAKISFEKRLIHVRELKEKRPDTDDPKR